MRVPGIMMRATSESSVIAFLMACSMTNITAPRNLGDVHETTEGYKRHRKTGCKCQSAGRRRSGNRSSGERDRLSDDHVRATAAAGPPVRWA